MQALILTLIWTLIFVIVGELVAYFKYLSRVKDDNE